MDKDEKAVETAKEDLIEAKKILGNPKTGKVGRELVRRAKRRHSKANRRLAKRLCEYDG